MTASIVTNHKAIHTADVSGIGIMHLEGGEFAYLRCRLIVRQSVQTVQLLAKIRKTLTSKPTAFAIPNENDEAERSGSHASSDDQVLRPLEYNHGSIHLDGEAAASVSESGAGLFQRAEHSYTSKPSRQIEGCTFTCVSVRIVEYFYAEIMSQKLQESATNLIHYMALKCLDTELFKDDLALISLLNLKTINSSVLASLNTGIQLLESLQLKSVRTDENVSSGICTQEKLDQQKIGNFTISMMRMKACLNGDILFGPPQDSRLTHVVTTVGRESLESETLLTDPLKARTSGIRINCARGNPEIWSEIIRRVKRSSQMLEAPCEILMDLARPKLRTSNLNPGPCVLKISLNKNATGNVIFPAPVWLSHKGAGTPHLSPDAVLFIDDQEFLTEIKVGDNLRFFDSRGKKRILKI